MADRSVWAAVLLVGCASSGTDSAAPPSDLVPLEGLPLLRRYSLDLRGTLPETDEVELVRAHPELAADVGRTMLDDPAFERRFADLVAEQWLTRVDEFNVGAVDFGLGEAAEPAFVRDVGSEVPVFLAAVAAEDLPWSTAVTADWTMSTDLLMSAWAVEPIDGRDSATPGWVRARYTDGRPPGGVVMTNGMWWRYWSAPNNYNRTRAAAIGRLLLCDDWLVRPVHVDPATDLQVDGLEEAVRSQPACVGCHDSLDPLAAALFGFWWFDLYDANEMRVYHPEREFLGERYLGTSPAWFGRPMGSPAELGGMIAQDPRFLRCAAQRVAQSYWRREPGDADFERVNGLMTAFEGGGYTMRSLIRAVLDDPEYAASGFVDGADVDEHIATRRALQPRQLATLVQDLTGYEWTEAGYEQLDNDIIGFRVLAGGIDGQGVTVPGETPSVTRALVQQRLAEAAARHVAEADLAAARGDRRLLMRVGPSDRPTDPVFAEQLTDLHARLHGDTPSAEEQEEELALAESLFAAGADATAVWAALVELQLRDPAFWTY